MNGKVSQPRSETKNIVQLEAAALTKGPEAKLKVGAVEDAVVLVGIYEH